MTYQQIELAEKYIARAKYIKDKSNYPAEFLHSESNTLDTEAKASGIGYKGDCIDWRDAVEWSEGECYYNIEQIKRILDTIIAELNGLLIAIPYYGLLCDIRKDIKRGNQTKNSKKFNFVVEMVTKYDGKISFGKVVLDYIKDGDLVLSSNTEPIFNGVAEKLKIYMQELCEEKKTARSNSGKSTTTNININQQQQNTQTATANQTVSVTFEDCFKSLDDCETIHENKAELNEIKQQITELQNLLKDSKGKKIMIREKISSLLKWIADKGTDVMTAVLPVVLAGLQKL